MFGLGGKLDFETTMLRALDRRDVAAIRRLIRSHGADARDRDGRTLLINAVSRGDLEMTSIALEVGCNPSAADNQGLTGLHFAVIGANLPIAERLLAAGAPVNAKDDWGNTPLNRAVPLPGVPDAATLVSALITSGADPYIANDHGVTPASWAREDPTLRNLLGLET